MIFILLPLVLLLLFIDCIQTIHIQNKPLLHETNPVLGPHPNDWKVVLYFFVWSTGLSLLTFFYSESELLLALISLVLLVEITVILKNHYLGL